MNEATAAITTLLFDWDGTLVDSAHLGLAAYEKSFAALGEKFDREIYQQAYSPNWYSTYRALGLPQEKWAVADELWVKHYDESTAELVPGARETIGALARKGYRLGVVSSGNDCRVQREIDTLGLAGAFKVVICNEQMQNKKPHPEGIETAMKVIGSSPAETCYIGDSPEDIEMGKRARVFTVGVRSAYPTSWKLADAGPDIWLDSLATLPQHF